MGEPLAEADLLPRRSWNPWDIAVFGVLDNAENGPLTVRDGDSDGSGSRASAGGFAR